MNENKIRLLGVLIFQLCALLSKAQNTFQHYRIQHQNINWNVYQTKKLTLYTQEESEGILKETLPALPDMIKEIEDTLQFKLKKKYHVIIYNSQKDFEQRNIGQLVELQNPGGTLNFTGGRIQVVYKGKIKELLLNIKTALYLQILLEKVYGSQLQEYLKNLIKGEYPPWILDEVAHALAKNIDIRKDNNLAFFLLTGEQKRFEDILQWDQQVAGIFFFHFLSEKYGTHSFVELLRKFQQRKPLDKSFKEVYKQPLWWLQESMLAFYGERYKIDWKQFDSVKSFSNYQGTHRKGNRKREGTYIVNHNTDTNTFLVLEKWEGNCQLVKYEEGRKWEVLRKVKCEGKLSNNFLFNKGYVPKLLWFYERNGKLFAEEISFNVKNDIKSITTRVMNDIDEIIQVKVGTAEHNYWILNSLNGKTKISEYNLLKNKMEDLELNLGEISTFCFSDEDSKKGLYVITNKKDNIEHPLDINKKDTFYCHFIPDTELAEAKQKWNPNLKKETVSIPFSAQELYFHNTQLLLSSNHSGVQLLYHFDFKTGKINALHAEPISYDGIELDGDSALLFFNQGDSLFRYSKKMDISVSIRKTCLAQEIENYEDEHARIQQEMENKKSKSGNSTFPMFQADSAEVQTFKDEEIRNKTYDLNKLKPYHIHLTTEYLSAQLDNTLLFNKYQSYKFNQGQFHQPKLGGMLKFAFTDIFENHVVQMALRIPSQANGSDFYIQYQNLKRNMDWKLSYFRHVEKFFMENKKDWIRPLGYFVPPYIKQKIHYLEGEIIQPFSKTQALHASLAFRNDRQVYLATDTTSLRFKDSISSWIGARLMYQLDKSKETIPFVRKGYRAKLFLEYHAPITKSPAGFIHVGIDLRRYQPLYKNIVWAMRINTAVSGGESNGIMYTLGGQQNGIAHVVDTTANFQPSDNYAFVAYATDLRGYHQNIRYGNLFLLGNTEIRIPIFNTFKIRQTSLISINHLQLVPFFDIGNAWKSPLKSESKRPFAFSYGIGLRTLLISYYVRMDIAWQSSTQFEQRKPMVMWAIGREW